MNIHLPILLILRIYRNRIDYYNDNYYNNIGDRDDDIVIDDDIIIDRIIIIIDSYYIGIS
jgi:hypothetical protein